MHDQLAPSRVEFVARPISGVEKLWNCSAMNILHVNSYLIPNSVAGEYGFSGCFQTRYSQIACVEVQMLILPVTCHLVSLLMATCDSVTNCAHAHVVLEFCE